MIQFLCDSCQRVRENDEAWVLGLAAEAVGVTSARREINILSVWEREASVHPLAVHFCSLECKDNYIDKLFREEPTEAVPPVRTVTATITRPARTRSKKSGAKTLRRRKVA